MSNIIPPLLSDSPPPPPPLDDDEDDEFGDFTGTNDFSFSCDNSSLPESPFNSPKKQFDSPPIINETLDINRNTKDNKILEEGAVITKDYQDRRKDKLKEDFLPEKVTEVNSDISQPPSILREINSYASEEKIDKFENSVSTIKICAEQKEDYNQESSNIFMSNKCITNGVEIEQKPENKISTESISLNEVVNSNTSDEQHFNTITDKSIQQITCEYENELCSNGISKSDKTNFQHVEFENGIEVENHVISKNVSQDEDKLVEPKDLTTDILNDDYEKFGDFNASVSTNSPQRQETKTNKTINQETENINEKLDENSLPNSDNDVAFVTEELTNSEKYKVAVPIEVIPTDIDDDDFGDFVSEVNIPNKMEDDDDFADFTSARTATTTKISIPEIDDDFDDFASWEQSPVVQKVDESAPQFDVDFSAATTKTPQTKDSFDINEHNVFDKAREVFKEIFPVPDEGDEEDTDCTNLDEIIKIDILYNQIEDFTQAHALKFQYAKSQCREILLKALNIDVRNIFPGMPRFAANLGPTPLEPVRSDLPAPPLALKAKRDQPPSEPACRESKPVDVPSAQFDWSGSGLQNPLDSMTAKGPQLTPQPQSSKGNVQPIVRPISSIPKTTQNIVTSKVDLEVKESPLDEFSDFTSHQPTSCKIDQKNNISVSKANLEVKELPTDDFSDFTSHQPDIQAKGFNVLLRETHISSQSNLNSELFLEEIEKDVIDDFDDFQVAIPDTSNKTMQLNSDFIVKPLENDGVTKKVDYDTHKILEKLSELKRKVSNTEVVSQVETNPSDNSSGNVKQAETDRRLSTKEPNEKVNVDKFPKEQASLNTTQIQPAKHQESPKQPSLPDEDDEFTDFHSSEPPKNTVPQPVTPILEPLKPAVVPIQPKQHQPLSQGQITWPNPGITDDDIRNFELNYSRVQDTSKDDIITISKESLSHSKEIKTISSGVKAISKQFVSKENSKKTTKDTKKPVAKQDSMDDEWSDFVSVQKTSPVHKLQERDRSSTPDLPLSVLNLSSLQPARKPIPVITPQGLIQTKLSSTMISPVTQSRTRVMQPKIEQLPINLISNQYASHMSYGNFNGFNGMSIQQGSSISQNTSSGTADDDDWSDFVSHQTSSSVPRKTQHNQNSMQFGSWTSAAPNIITNPVSDFNRRQARRTPGNQGASPTKRYGLQGISMPELGFVAPKNRTSHRK